MSSSTPFIIAMRESFFESLYKIFKEDKNTMMIVADNGSVKLDQFATDFPDQYFQVGISEQNGLGICAGLSVEGRKTYLYAINPFVTLRIAEFVKLDACAMNNNITLLGVGSGFSYAQMGPTHHSVDEIGMMRAFPNLTIWNLSDANMAAQLAYVSHQQQGPQYIRFDRAGIPDLYNNQQLDLSQGLFSLGTIDNLMPDVYIISTGRFVYEAKLIAEKLFKEKEIVAEVIDVFRLKPFNLKKFKELIPLGSKIVTYEEHYLKGGLGSIVLEELNDDNLSLYFPILRLGVQNKFSFEMGGREHLWKLHELDIDTVANKIITFVR